MTEATKTEAIAQADAELNNAGLPTYSELLAALRGVTMCSEARFDSEPLDAYETRRAMLKQQQANARAVLARGVQHEKR